MPMVLAADRGSFKRAIGGFLPIANPEPLMTKLAADLQRSVKRNFSEGGRPVRWIPSKRALATGGKTLIDHGSLLLSVYRRGVGEKATVFTNDHRAFIHEYGGVILPKKAKALAIPVHKITKGLPPSVFDPNREQTFLLKREGKPALIMYRPSKDVSPFPIYILQFSVRIPARPFIEPPQEDLDKIMVPRVEQYVKTGKP